MHKLNLSKYRFGLFLLLLVVIDRIAWASIAQWREDQATNIWLGFTQPINQIPIGLISSYGIPNPNGMVLLGKLLSFLPNLWVVGTFLGCLQAAIIIWIAYEFAEKSCKNSNVFFWVLSLPLLTSILLRVVSVEFWNQWMVLLINLIFLLWITNYYRKPSLSKIPFLIGLILFAPAIYLAGVLNAFVMFVLGGFVILYKLPENWRLDWLKPAIAGILVISVIFWIIWLPYFREIGKESFFNLNTFGSLSNKGRIFFAVDAIVRFPLWIWIHWQNQTAKFFIPRSGEMISDITKQFIHGIAIVHFLQMVLALGALAYSTLNYWKCKKTNNRHFLRVNRHIVFIIIVSLAFVMLSFAFSPLFGGPLWAHNERPDQIIAFYPFFVVFWTLLPFVFVFQEPHKKRITAASTFLVAVFAIMNLIAGVMIVKGQLFYRGDVLTNADVPLIQVEQAVDFVAQDWLSVSDDPTIPVDYQLGGQVWDWIPEFGKVLDGWYSAPYTLGRTFDYELLRRYGLKNSQEGVQIRSFGGSRYLLNYAFEPPPQVNGFSVENFVFGRIRVTIVNHTGQVE